MRYLKHLNLPACDLTKEEEDYLDCELRHDLWCKKNRGNHGRNLHISQTLHIFKDEIHAICYDHIKVGDNVEHWKDILRQLDDKDKMEFNEKISRAKQIPIESLISEIPKQNKIVCPFHEDSTPSLHIYTDTNSYYCFVCHAGGDVIDYIMRLNNLTFVEAVKYLI